MADSFFVPLADDGSRWRATTHTIGPWDPGAQHGGPPSALLARAVERCAPRDDVQVARMTVEILGQIPVGELDLRVRMARPGRSVELVEAVLSAAGRDVARASGWRVRRTEGVQVDSREPVPPPVPEGPGGNGLGGADAVGYLAAVEWRSVRGGFDVPGPSAAWARLRHPLVADEPTSPLQRLMCTADSGNGISSELDWNRWLFINPELTVHVHREPVGEWLCLDARTTVSDGGCGLATSVLSDQQGPVAVGAQSLLVAPRG